jgi:hypothetical protein
MSDGERDEYAPPSLTKRRSVRDLTGGTSNHKGSPEFPPGEDDEPPPTKPGEGPSN